MELDRELISAIGKMDDASLQAGIERIATSLGVSPQLAKHYLGDSKRVKEMVGKLSQEDLDRIVQTLGEEKASSLAAELQREIGN